MKKAIIPVLLLSMLVLILSACGGSAGKSADSGNPVDRAADAAEGEAADSGDAADSEEASANGSDGIYKEKGSELTDFINSITETEKLFEDPINKIIDTVPIDQQMDRLLVGLAMMSMPAFDLISMEDLPREEGPLMLGGYDGVREKTGDEIKISATKTYTEDNALFRKAGDVFSEKGSLNTRTNTLIYESKMERGGSVIDRTVLEVVILENGTYLIQYRDYSSGTERDPASATAVLKRFSKDEYTAITAETDPKPDFTYDSIAGKGDMQADAMATTCTVTGKFTVTGGTASFSK